MYVLVTVVNAWGKNNFNECRDDDNKISDKITSLIINVKFKLINKTRFSALKSAFLKEYALNWVLTFFMNSMEKSMLLDELFSLRKADKAERELLLAKLDRMTE